MRWLLMLLLLAPASAAAQPLSDLTLQAQILAADGSPVNGTVEVEIEIFDRPNPAPAAQPLYAELQRDVPVDEGLAALRLGSGEPLTDTPPPAEPGPSPRYVRLWVDGQPTGPATELAAPAPPWAQHAVDLPAPGLRVFDADDNEIGVYAGERIWGERYLAHRPGLGLTLRLGARSGDLDPRGVEIFWELPNCTGQAYVDRSYRGVVFGRDADGYVLGTATQALSPLRVESRQADLEAACENRQSLADRLIPLTSIPQLDLELPVAAPVHAGLVGP